MELVDANSENRNVDFKTSMAVSFQEKLNVLEERDKCIRQKAVTRHRNIATEERMKGTCPDMCPEKERLLRELNCAFSIFESTVVGNERHVIPELLVKEYARSSADQDEPLSHELRPEPVLTTTMRYLIDEIMCREDGHGGSKNAGEWYHFCSDRLRGIRKDIIQQQLCNQKVVLIVEQCAKFHIWCYDAFCGQEKNVFEDRLNTENLVNCLQLLSHMYDDLAKCNVPCENEAEFRIYMALLQLNESDLMWLYPKYCTNPRLSNRMRELGRIYTAYSQTWYTNFFSLVRDTSYLNACILQRFFSSFRIGALKMTVDSHCPGNKAVKFSLSTIRNILKLDDLEETMFFVGECGFPYDAINDEVILSKSQFSAPSRMNLKVSSNLIKTKRVPLLRVLTGNDELSPMYEIYKVHSSFSAYDTLNGDAYDAFDQEKKLLNRFKHYNPGEDNLFEIRVSKQQHLINEGMEKEGAIDYEMKEDDEYEMKDDDYDDNDDDDDDGNNKPEGVESIIASSFDSDEQSSDLEVEADDDDHVDGNRVIIESDKQDDMLSDTNKTILNSDFAAKGANIFEKKLQSPKMLRPFSFSPSVVPTYCNRSVLGDTASPSSSFSMNITKSKSILSEDAARMRFVHAENTFLKNLAKMKNEIERNDRSRTEKEARQKWKESRQLRKTLKKKFKKKCALKYARLWRTKITNIKDNLAFNRADINRISVQDHLRIWGCPGLRPAASENLSKRLRERNSACRKSDGILNADEVQLPAIGPTVAENLYGSLIKPECNSKTDLLFWKAIVFLPDVRAENFRVFSQKLKEICQLAFVNSADEAVDNVGTVRELRTSAGIKILVSLGLSKSEEESHGWLNGAILISSEKWESTCELVERIDRVVSSRSSNSSFPIVVVGIGELGDTAFVNFHLEETRKSGLISDFAYIQWKNFYTILNAVCVLSEKSVPSPPVAIKPLPELLENASDDFFSLLSSNEHLIHSSASPNVYIRLYNSLLLKLANTLTRSAVIPLEFAPYLKNDSKNNLQHPEAVCEAFSQCQLGYFKMWPPISVEKMVQILRKYCRNLDESECLYATVIRLIDPSDDETVYEVSNRVPWIRIVETWVRYTLRNARAGQSDFKYITAGYSPKDISQLTADFWWLEEQENIMDID